MFKKLSNQAAVNQTCDPLTSCDSECFCFNGSRVVLYIYRYHTIQSICIGNIASQEVKIHKETHVQQNQRIEIS